MGNETHLVRRYSVQERVNHWWVALTVILLALSGLAFFHPAFFFLTGLFGDNYLLVDRTQERLGFAPRVYPSFAAAAEEAAMSRLYGGIHFRSANEAGLAQGRCIGSKVMALKMGH